MTNKAFNKAFFVLSISVFSIVAIRAYVLPFSRDEAVTFFFYIQSGSFLPFTSHIDVNNHILNSFFGWICFHLFGDSPFSLRLPNLAGLVVLIVSIKRLAGRLTHTSSKIILVVGLLLSFHWLSFFSLCRGYGISMSLIVLAISYIPDYIENKSLADILKIYILLDLAVCANLTLIIAVLIITVLISLFQLYRHVFFKAGNISMLFIHAGIILFWIRYSFFLKELNMFYVGKGDSYWNVTFASLIDMIVGRDNPWISISIITLYITLMGIYLSFVIKNVRQVQSDHATFTLFLVILLCGLIIGCYILKKLCSVNFPENRTGLFFYMFFILNAAFIIDMLKPYFSNPVAVIIVVVFAAHFAVNLNFRKHSPYMYRIIPERFYDRLLLEQKKYPEKIIIGGNAVVQANYVFMNYRNGDVLNPMGISGDEMCMNADYYIGMKKDKGCYAPYYQEIDTDEDCYLTLLKRKQPLARKLLFTTGMKNIEISEDKEYFNFFEIKDTIFKSPDPLLVELNFKVLDGDMPSGFWLGLSLDSSEGKAIYNSEIALNWIKYNWQDTGKSTDIIFETGLLPPKIYRLRCYLWNCASFECYQFPRVHRLISHFLNWEGQRLKMRVNAIKVFQLKGIGMDMPGKLVSR